MRQSSSFAFISSLAIIGCSTYSATLVSSPDAGVNGGTANAGSTATSDTTAGGATASGGDTSSPGGAGATGGAAATIGSSSATGGVPTIIGGSSALGGATPTGAAPSAGSSGLGGASTTGGASASNGGGLPTGGGDTSTATGGASSTSPCGSGTTAGSFVCGNTCCSADQFCMDNSSCGPKARPGSACPYGIAQCTTNFCVEGYCCNAVNCGFGETCATGSCACSAGAAKVCSGCAVWDFEWGNVATPWVNETSPNWGDGGNGTTGIQISSSVFHPGTGSHSLVAEVDIMLGTSVQSGVAVALPCAANLAGYAYTFWLYVAGPTLPNWNDGVNIDTWSSSATGTTVPTVMVGVPTGQWFFVTGALPVSDSALVDHIGIRLVPAMGWTGQMYIDDFVLTAPRT